MLIFMGASSRTYISMYSSSLPRLTEHGREEYLKINKTWHAGELEHTLGHTRQSASSQRFDWPPRNNRKRGRRAHPPSTRAGSVDLDKLGKKKSLVEHQNHTGRAERQHPS